MEKEIWKDIKGYPNYMVSSWGRVKSLNYNHTGKERILKQQLKRGYLYVGLRKNKKFKHCGVHRLVAEAFLDNPNNLPEVNHKDENKTNNFVSNLEFCDRKYNMNYGTARERMIKGLINHSKKSKPVLQIDKNTNEVIAVFPSIREVERQLGFANQHISSCCNGKFKQVYGYKWSFK